MPRYSPSRKVFTSVNKDIKDIPFQDVLAIYMDAKTQLQEDADNLAREKYKRRILELEIQYSEMNPEAGSYEGNFSDVVNISESKGKVPLKLLNKYTTEAIATEFLAKYNIALHAEWVMPQIVTLLGGMPTYKNSNGLLSGTQFKKNNFDSDWLKGLFTMTMISTKSSYLNLQYKAPSKYYGALIPLVMYAQRLNKGTPYAAWDRSEIRNIVHSDLADAMLYSEPLPGKETILACRSEGLLVKSGKTQGTMKNPITTHGLTGVSDPSFSGLPSLLQIMLAQIWMAHPANRTKYMILDSTNWDNVPAPLIEEDVLRTPKATNNAEYGEALW